MGQPGVWRRLREAPAYKLLDAIIDRIPRVLFHADALYVTEGSALPELAQGAAHVSVERSARKDAIELADVFPRADDPGFERRFRAGHVGLIARIRGEIVGMAWLDPTAAHIEPGKFCTFIIPADSAYIYDLAIRTDTSANRMLALLNASRVAPALLRALLEEAHAHGRQRLCGYVRWSNKRWLRAMEHFGHDRVQRILLVNVLGLRVHRVRDLKRGAPPATRLGLGGQRSIQIAAEARNPFAIAEAARAPRAAWRKLLASRPTKVLHAALDRIPRGLFHFDILYLTETSRLAPLALRTGDVLVERIGPRNVPEVARVFPRSADPRFERRFKAGHVGFVARLDGDVVGMCWFDPGPQHVEDEKFCTFLVPADAAWTYDLAIVKDGRITRAAPALRRALFEEARALGRRRVCGYARWSNRMWLQALARLGHSRIQHVIVVNLLGLRIHRVRDLRGMSPPYTRIGFRSAARIPVAPSRPDHPPTTELSHD